VLRRRRGGPGVAVLIYSSRSPVLPGPGGRAGATAPELERIRGETARERLQEEKGGVGGGSPLPPAPGHFAGEGPTRTTRFRSSPARPSNSSRVGYLAVRSLYSALR